MCALNLRHFNAIQRNNTVFYFFKSKQNVRLQLDLDLHLTKKQ